MVGVEKKTHWEEVYRTKSPTEVSWFQRQPAVSVELIEACGIGRDDPVIDVGGGASRLVDQLLVRGFRRLAVLDISGTAIVHAKERLGKNADSVEWYETDITGFVPPHPFALWHDRAVFHFLTAEADRRRYVEALRKATTPMGHVIIATFAIGGPEKCSGLDIVQYDAPSMCAELGNGFELVEERDELHITPADKEQKFAYFRFRRV